MPAEATIEPSKDHATTRGVSLCRPNRRVTLPVDASYRTTVGDWPTAPWQAATKRPPGWNATRHISCGCLPDARGLMPVEHSCRSPLHASTSEGSNVQRWNLRSHPPVANVKGSFGDQSTEVTWSLCPRMIHKSSARRASQMRTVRSADDDASSEGSSGEYATLYKPPVCPVSPALKAAPAPECGSVNNLTRPSQHAVAKSALAQTASPLLSACGTATPKTVFGCSTTSTTSHDRRSPQILVVLSALPEISNRSPWSLPADAKASAVMPPRCPCNCAEGFLALRYETVAPLTFQRCMDRSVAPLASRPSGANANV
mmetsp:Transcript_73448/g.204009  ORF Transcript_73448/g.204009 Transcript_73448/m.204009 type:complete len:315 (+) Transcript_73448:373-1317(+)